MGTQCISRIEEDNKKKKHSEFLEIKAMIAGIKPPEMNWRTESIQIKFPKVNWKIEPTNQTTVPEDWNIKLLRLRFRR